MTALSVNADELASADVRKLFADDSDVELGNVLAGMIADELATGAACTDDSFTTTLVERYREMCGSKSRSPWSLNTIFCRTGHCAAPARRSSVR